MEALAGTTIWRPRIYYCTYSKRNDAQLAWRSGQTADAKLPYRFILSLYKCHRITSFSPFQTFVLFSAFARTFRPCSQEDIELKYLTQLKKNTFVHCTCSHRAQIVVLLLVKAIKKERSEIFKIWASPSSPCTRQGERRRKPWRSWNGHREYHQ